MYKLILSGFLFLVHTAVFAQLNGHYNHRNEWTSETFIFKKKHRVDYAYYGEESIIKGTGKYKLKGDSLVLYFSKHPLDTPAQNIEVVHTTGDNSSCVLYIQVMEKNDSSSAMGALITLANKEKILQGAYTNGDGKAELKTPATGDSLHLLVKYRQFPPLSFSCLARGKYFISAYIEKEGTKYYKKGDTQVFYVENKTIKDMKLTRVRGSQGTVYSKLIP